MGSHAVDNGAITNMLTDPLIDSRFKALAQSIADDAIANITSMGAVDTGRLRNSIEVQGTGSEYTVYTDVDYAAYVHEGTQHVPAKPFLANASLKQRGKLP